MLETIGKNLIEAIKANTISMDALTAAIENNAVGGPDKGPRIPQTPAEAVVMSGSDAPDTITQEAPPNPAPTEVAQPDTEHARAAIALQEKVMHVAQTTANPMLGMRWLAQYGVNQYHELTAEQIAYVSGQMDLGTSGEGVPSNV